MKTIQELVPLIQEWAKERGIFDKSTPFDQLLKTHEEVGELIKACYDNDKPAIQDAIGDTMICLINYCYMIDGDAISFFGKYKKTFLDEYAKGIYTSITLNETLSELMRSACIYKIRISDSISLYISLIFDCLYTLADLYNITLEECLNIAYNEIKDRTGKMINGKFVKDEKHK
jgi:hypothetical protein|nr:MAG TPA: NTP-PPase-like protein [Caudoviricetes sp.]